MFRVHSLLVPVAGRNKLQRVTAVLLIVMAPEQQGVCLPAGPLAFKLPTMGYLCVQFITFQVVIRENWE